MNALAFKLAQALRLHSKNSVRLAEVGPAPTGTAINPKKESVSS